MALPESHNALDVSQLTSLRQSVAAGAAGSHQKVAQQFEGLFLSMMLKNMRQAMTSGSALDNNESKMATEMFDNQLAQNLSTGRGIGLASALEKQLDRAQVKPAPGTGTTPIPLHASAAGLPLAAPHGFALTPRTSAAGLPLAGPARAFMIAPTAVSGGHAGAAASAGPAASPAASATAPVNVPVVPSLLPATPVPSLPLSLPLSSSLTSSLSTSPVSSLSSSLAAPLSSSPVALLSAVSSANVGEVDPDSDVALSASVGGAPVPVDAGGAATASALQGTGSPSLSQQILEAAFSIAGVPVQLATLGPGALPSSAASGSGAISASAAATSASAPATTAASGSAGASTLHESFVQRFKDAALSAAEATGIPAKVILGQAALESGWGQHEARGAHGQASYNLFGIKAGSDWTGKTVESVTTEYVNGVAHKVVQKFRAYASYAESFMDYANTVANSPRYARAMNQAHDPTQFASAIGRSGYATDPQYAQKLVAVINGPLKHVA